MSSNDKSILQSGEILYIREHTEEVKRLCVKIDNLNKRVTFQNALLFFFLIIGIVLLVWKWEYIFNAISILFNTIGDRL